MDVVVMERNKMMCISCMEEHEVQTVSVLEHNVFKGVDVEYEAVYFYCDRTDEYYADEEMISKNDIAMKNAYRRAKGLLTSDEIIAIRNEYGINQRDLCCILKWGEKTIARYEGHQVQDAAHDAILRKLGDDPEWFLSLLEAEEKNISSNAYELYSKSAAHLFEKKQDLYLRKSILAKYAKYQTPSLCNGNKSLSLDAVVDVVRYFANSVKVRSLYLVKLLKLMWYSDALSFDTRGISITGLVYSSQPMGAVPIAYDSIKDLYGITYEEVESENGIGYKFKSTDDKQYPNLTAEDIAVLDRVIDAFGLVPRERLVDIMHQEEAYIKTTPSKIISFEYAHDLKAFSENGNSVLPDT